MTEAPKTYAVTINGKVPTRAILQAHGAHDLADTIPTRTPLRHPDDPAAFTDRTQAEELAARCTRWFPEDTVTVETR